MDTSLLINDMINKYFREDFYKASLVADNLKQIMEETKRRYGLNAIILTDALSSIIENGFSEHLSSYRAKTKRMKTFHNALWKFSNGKNKQRRIV